MNPDLSELRSTVDACEKDFSESSKSISILKEEDYPDTEAYLVDFYERIHGFLDRTNDLITAYREYIAVLEKVCTEQEE